MMNKQLKSKWVKALRSGKYKQGQGTLRIWDKVSHRSAFCCLGVLRELMPADLKTVSEKDSFGKPTGALSNKQLKFTGLTRKKEEVLIEMNDAIGNTFKEIADYIEQKL